MITWLKGIWPQKRKPRFKKRNNVAIFFLKLCFTTFNLEPIFKYEPNFQRDLIGVKLFTGLVQTYEHSLLICVHVCACTCVCVCVCVFSFFENFYCSHYTKHKTKSIFVCILHTVKQWKRSIHDNFSDGSVSIYLHVFVRFQFI